MKVLPLKKDDAIGFISPAGPLKPESVDPALQRLTDLGYRCRLGQYAFDDHGIVSSTVEHRLADIHSFLENPEIRAIWALRGGYGTVQLFRDLNYELILTYPKILVGFSDVTALQWAWHQKTGLTSISGLTMTLQMGPDNPYVAAGLRILSGECLAVSNRDLVNPVKVVRHGRASGVLLGGTLSMIASICGSEYWPLAEPVILYIEDVEEPLYRIDRCLQQLSLAGLFDRTNAIILGHFTWQEQFLDILELLMPLLPTDIPVISGFPYGHVSASYPLPNGVPANLETTPFLLEWAPFTA